MSFREKLSTLAELTLTFMRIGLFTIGGGYAMIPVIENACVDKKSWITHEEMLTLLAVAESTPGPIAINCATYIGHKRAGLAGALAATIGICAPSFAIIYLISLVFDDFLALTVVANAFKGIKCAVALLIAEAGLRMLKKMKKNALTVSILAAAVAGTLAADIFALRISSVALIIGAAVLGMLFSRPERKGGDGE